MRTAAILTLSLLLALPLHASEEATRAQLDELEAALAQGLSGDWKLIDLPVQGFDAAGLTGEALDRAVERAQLSAALAQLPPEARVKLDMWTLGARARAGSAAAREALAAAAALDKPLPAAKPEDVWDAPAAARHAHALEILARLGDAPARERLARYAAWTLDDLYVVKHQPPAPPPAGGHMVFSLQEPNANAQRLKLFSHALKLLNEFDPPAARARARAILAEAWPAQAEAPGLPFPAFMHARAATPEGLHRARIDAAAAILAPELKLDGPEVPALLLDPQFPFRNRLALLERGMPRVWFPHDPQAAGAKPQAGPLKALLSMVAALAPDAAHADLDALGRPAWYLHDGGHAQLAAALDTWAEKAGPEQAAKAREVAAALRKLPQDRPFIEALQPDAKPERPATAPDEF